MKTAIHPPYHRAKVNCACGNTFTVGSTKERLDIEICSACHPFYTGGSKLVDTAGRVEKFKARLAKKKTATAKKKAVTREELQNHRESLQHQLANPEVYSDQQKVKELSRELSRIEKELKEAATSSGGPENVIMEIRAGAGGIEAALFARSVFEMYSKFATKNAWETTLIEESKSERGGIKEIVFAINGAGAYEALRRESGVHRVQRIPETEKSGRIHTSTASVAVLKQARETDLEIRPQDIKIEFFRSSGPGGQNVNKVETAVRYHLPSGLIVTSQDSRSQQKNREAAMTLLRSKLLDEKLRQEAEKSAAERRSQIGTADRSEKIRTYNFPQDRVTDHRIKQSWHNLPSIMDGNLEPIVEALQNT